jgi:hypothetical protein
MFFMQILFALVLGVASIGSLAFAVIEGHLQGRSPAD